MLPCNTQVSVMARQPQAHKYQVSTPRSRSHLEPSYTELQSPPLSTHLLHGVVEKSSGSLLQHGVAPLSGD